MNRREEFGVSDEGKTIFNRGEVSQRARHQIAHDFYALDHERARVQEIMSAALIKT